MDRASGVLLHPTSFPSRFGTGDLGHEAYQFVDWLAAAGQSYWQVLPLNPVDAGYSPYQSPSSFAGNPLLISLEKLLKRSFSLQRNSIRQRLPAPTGVVCQL